MKRACVLLTAAAAVAAGCGDGGSAQGEPSDPPAKPPTGWRSVRNAEAGFTLSVPRDWTVSNEGKASVLKSPDEVDALTVTADRGGEARMLDAATYARQAIDALPGFEGSLDPTAKRVTGSPYRSARLDGVGRVKGSGGAARFTVVAFQRPGRVTYTAVIFRNARVIPSFDEQRIKQVLRSFRAQRSGRSG